MRGSCASKRGNIAKTKYLNFIGYLKGKSTLMIYDRHPELQSKWDNVFWNRGYLNITVRRSRQSGVARATCPD